MNEEFGKRGDYGQGNHIQPCYDFYAQGITEARKGWFEALVALIKNARGKILVAVVVVLALCKVACEFLEKGSNNLSYQSISGAILIASMIFIIGLVSLWRTKNTDDEQEEKRQKGKVKSLESGTGRISTNQDRRASTRDGGPNLDGGGK